MKATSSTQINAPAEEPTRTEVRNHLFPMRCATKNVATKLNVTKQTFSGGPNISDASIAAPDRNSVTSVDSLPLLTWL
jgi:hypothetical protein